MGFNSIQVNILYFTEFSSATTWGVESFKVYFMQFRNKCSLGEKAHNKQSISIQTDKC